MPAGAPNVMNIVEKLRPDLIKLVEKWRKEAMTHEQIARQLSDVSGVPIGREIIRRWFARVK